VPAANAQLGQDVALARRSLTSLPDDVLQDDEAGQRTWFTLNRLAGPRPGARQSKATVAPSQARFGSHFGSPPDRMAGRMASELWSYGDSNPGPLACHASALPTEL
jgi:hypothetical protein